VLLVLPDHVVLKATYYFYPINAESCAAFTRAGLWFDNQVPNEKLVYEHFCVVKVTQILVHEEDEVLLKIADMKFEFQNLKSVFTNVRFRSWSSKPLSVNATLVIKAHEISKHSTQNFIASFCHSDLSVCKIFDCFRSYIALYYTIFALTKQLKAPFYDTDKNLFAL